MNQPDNAGEAGWSSELGRSPEEGNGMDRGAWQATVHGVSKSQTQPSTPPYSNVMVLQRGQSRLLQVECVGEGQGEICQNDWGDMY